MRAEARYDVESLTHISAEAPTLELDEVFSSSMSLNGFNAFFQERSVTPSASISLPVHSIGTINGSPTSSNPDHDHFQKHIAETSNGTSNGCDTPTRRPARYLAYDHSPNISEADPSIKSQAPSYLGTPLTELEEIPWSAAVGRATTGKSGRVIEKLMGDMDRLQRAKNFSDLKSEEESKRRESTQLAYNMLCVTHGNCDATRDIHLNMIARKDRQIADLRADLASERARRAIAETAARETNRERDEVVEKCKREVIQEKELAKRAISQYELLSSSWKNLDSGHRKQLQGLKEDVSTLTDEVTGDKQKLAKLEVVLEQMRQEADKSRRAKDKISEEFEAYKKEHEEGIRGIKEQAERNDIANAEALREMNETVGQMRWAISVCKDVK